MRSANMKSKLAVLAAMFLRSVGEAVVEPKHSGFWNGLRRGQQSINYSKRAARSHAGKSAGYVKGH